MSGQDWADRLRDDPDDEELQATDMEEPSPPATSRAPRLMYGSVDEFLREFLRHAYSRPVGGGNARNRWAAEWWHSAEAVMRLEAMWRSWEHLRRDPATGMSAWWLQHADPHMIILMSPEGPFAKSEDRSASGEPLPYARPPEGLFPDER